MKTPLVSVVVASYNYGQFICHALDSILAQTFTDWEAIIVDDGSTDNTSSLVAPYLHDERFRYQRTLHVGQPAAKNLGIRLARGNYIAFLDADDVWHPTKLSKQIPLFNSDSVGVVYSLRHTISPSGELLSTVMCGKYFRGDVLRHMFRNNFVCFSSAVVHRRVFETAGLFDESISLAIDFDLWLRAACNFHFDYVDEPLVYYRTGHANLSTRAEERATLAIDIMRRFIAHHERGRRLSPFLVRRAFSEIHCSMALLQRGRQTDAAITNYLRAIRYAPWLYAPWRGLVALMLPESMRRVVRRALGRPVDWRVPTMSSLN